MPAGPLAAKAREMTALLRRLRSSSLVEADRQRFINLLTERVGRCLVTVDTNPSIGQSITLVLYEEPRQSLQVGVSYELDQIVVVDGEGRIQSVLKDRFGVLKVGDFGANPSLFITSKPQVESPTLWERLSESD
jgi:hypothetical protein